MPFRLFLFPFLILGDLIKSTINPQTRRSTVVLISVLMATCLTCFGVTSAVSTIGGAVSTPVSTIDINAISTDAMIKAWSSYTQTAEYLPTSTSIITTTPSPTDTILATDTLLPTATSTSLPIPTLTPRPTFTSLPPPTLVVIVPTQPAQAACSCSGDTLNCGNFSYQSSAQSCYNYCISVGAGDIHGLDGNNDGLACESLP
jgi:hypothetical protein